MNSLIRWTSRKSTQFSTKRLPRSGVNEKPRVVIDTQVLLRAVINRRSMPAQIVYDLIDARLLPIISERGLWHGFARVSQDNLRTANSGLYQGIYQGFAVDVVFDN